MPAFKPLLQIRNILIKAVDDLRLDYPLLLIDERQVLMATTQGPLMKEQRPRAAMLHHGGKAL